MHRAVTGPISDHCIAALCAVSIQHGLAWWSRRGLWSWRSWCRLGSRSRCGLRSGTSRQHPDIRATDELLDILHLFRTSTGAASEIRAVKVVVVPPKRSELVPVAAIISAPDATVPGKPVPLQNALIADHIFRDNPIMCVVPAGRQV